LVRIAASKSSMKLPSTLFAIGGAVTPRAGAPRMTATGLVTAIAPPAIIGEKSTPQ